MWRAPVEIDGIDVGQHQECIGGEVRGEQAGSLILVDNGLHALNAARDVPNDGNTTTTDADRHHTSIDQQADYLHLDDAFRQW